jgi:hypothetical protein
MLVDEDYSKERMNVVTAEEKIGALLTVALPNFQSTPSSLETKILVQRWSPRCWFAQFHIERSRHVLMNIRQLTSVRIAYSFPL